MKRALLAAAALGLTACSGTPGPVATTRTADPATCTDAVPIGRFDPPTDLLLAQFDIKTDVDDIQAAAALATILAQPGYDCVQAHAVHGAYGEQGGDFIPAPSLFDLAFGAAWSDAAASPARARERVLELVIDTLSSGGDVWIMEAGQSDFSAAMVKAAIAATSAETVATRIHIVQHSNWNEESTTDTALDYVKAHTDYIRIPDGNGEDNGSPGFASPDGSLWPRFVGAADTGTIWQEAKALSELHNGEGYLNPMIDRGGFDFSDAVEAAYIFGFEDMADVAAFADRFLVGG